ncbi:MAG: glycosyltransferase, partial [Ignavibacteriae bacterium]|nr:glycosyltransferase [Ignavibacteriota bacterium]
MHILIIPSWYPVSEKDLKVSFIREQAESLLKYDANLNVGVLNSLLDDMYSFSGMPLFNRIIKTRENGLNVYRSKCLNWFRRVPFLGLKIWIYEGMKLAKRYIREHGKPDIIHAHFMFYGGLLAARVSKKYNIPLVITEHNSGYARGFVKQWQLNLGIKAFSQASQCIAVSKNFAAYLDKKYKLPNNSWVYIPNMVSDIFFEYPLGCKNSKKDYFTFTTICHLNSNKGVDVLIKAFAKCFNNKKQIRLVIGGDGN